MTNAYLYKTYDDSKFTRFLNYMKKKLKKNILQSQCSYQKHIVHRHNKIIKKQHNKI